MATSCVWLVKQSNVYFSGGLLSRCCFCLSAVTRKQEKFSVGQKKKQNSSGTGSYLDLIRLAHHSVQSYKASGLSLFSGYKKQGGKVFHKSAKVFQLDPLTGEHAPPLTDTIRQSTVARVMRQAVGEVLTCPDVDARLRKHQVEVTEVQMTRDLGHATIIWRANEAKEDDSTVQRLLNEHKNDIRNLLPVYHRLHLNPQLNFIKDKTEQYASAVNRLLDEAEYGEDYDKPRDEEEQGNIDKQRSTTRQKTAN